MSARRLDRSESPKEASGVAVLESLDFAVACMSPLHVAGAWGHEREQGASYVVDVRCGRCHAADRQLLCRGRIDFGLAWGRTGGRFQCDLCGHVASVFAFWHAIEPLEGGVLA